MLFMLLHRGFLFISVLSHSGSLPYYTFCRPVTEYPTHPGHRESYLHAHCCKRAEPWAEHFTTI